MDGGKFLGWMVLCAALGVACGGSSAEDGSSIDGGAGTAGGDTGGTGGGSGGTGGSTGGAGGSTGGTGGSSGGTGGMASGTGGAGGAAGQGGVGAGGAAGSSGDGGVSGAQADFEALSACQAPSPCAKSFVQVIEGGTLVPPAVQRVDCVLDALAKRTPGLYEHETDHTFTNGAWTQMHLIRIHDDGSVSYAVEDRDRGAVEAVSYSAYGCELKDATYFESCLTLVENIATTFDEQAIKDCTYANGAMDQWFASCMPGPVECG